MTALRLARLDLEQPVVGADDELSGDGCAVGAGGEVGDVSLDPGQRPGLGLQFPVDAVGALAELDEPVPPDPDPLGEEGRELLRLAASGVCLDHISMFRPTGISSKYRSLFECERHSLGRSLFFAPLLSEAS